jgi:F-type H+-transporting ATPase subunit b
MMLDPEFWVAGAFVMFCGLLGYLGVHRRGIEALDRRQERIRAELDEARGLKEEAQNLLKQYRRKQHEAEGEAQAIIAGARAEAERFAAEAEIELEKLVARLTELADTKIAQAEAQALTDVRTAIADAAIATAEKVLTQVTTTQVTNRLIDQSIAATRSNLNERSW